MRAEDAGCSQQRLPPDEVKLEAAAPASIPSTALAALSLEGYYLGDGLGITNSPNLSIFKWCLAADGGSALASSELETAGKVTLLFSLSRQTDRCFGKEKPKPHLPIWISQLGRGVPA